MSAQRALVRRGSLATGYRAQGNIGRKAKAHQDEVLKINDPKDGMNLRMGRSCQVGDKKGHVGHVRMPRGSAESIVADRDLTA